MLAIRELPTPNEDDRRADVPIDMLILHYTGMRSAREAIERLRDPAAKVSSHYVVDEDGFVLRLVAEERRAYHAGVSYWRGHSDLNGRSIGIEIVNPGHEFGYRDFPLLQLAVVCDVCLPILSRHSIPARNIVAHSDVAPDRKEDPGRRSTGRIWRRIASGYGGRGCRTLARVVWCATRRPAGGARGAGGYWLSSGAGGRGRSGAVQRAARIPAALAAGGGNWTGGFRYARSRGSWGWRSW